MLRRLASYLRIHLGKARDRFDLGFRSAENFSRVLEIERHRADRTNLVFSLLMFATRGGRSDEATCAALAAILRQRLRLTDVVGWLDDARIGVIFPDTMPSGAWTVAEDVCRQFPK